MANRAEHIIGLLMLTTVAYVNSIFLLVPILGLNIWMLLIVATISIILLGIRALIIWFCPVFATFGIIIVFTLNVVLFFIFLLGLSFNLFINALIDIMKAIRSLSGHHSTMKHIKNIKLYKVSARNVVNYIRNIPTTCAPFDNVKTILEYVTHYFVGDYMCAFSRTMWPVSKIPSKGLSFTFANSAEPVTLVTGKNCDAAAPSGSLFYCVVLNIGIPVAEVIFPLLVMFVLWQIFGKAIKLTLSTLLYVAFLVGTQSLHALLYLFLIIES
jgi:hypothetical protein